MKSHLLPSQFLDCHHHYLDTANNPFQSFLNELSPNSIYLPHHYKKDVIEPISQMGVDFVGSIHVEAIPDDGIKEALWVDSFPADSSSVVGIVGSCDLTRSSVDQDLIDLKQASPKVKGVRWILDCVGKFNGETATHAATLRHDGIDYLRGNNGGYGGDVVEEFERGFALLGKHDLTFDLQCAPAQLEAAAKLFSRHPSIKVCIDHLGKPRTLLGPDLEGNDNAEMNEAELATWRRGMDALAALPNVYVKISMLGYALPGWIKDDKRTSMMKGLVLETVRRFGPHRSMVATNWWCAANLSDNDGLSDVGPDPCQLLSTLSDFFQEYSTSERERMFCGTAKEFYNIRI